MAVIQASSAVGTTAFHWGAAQFRKQGADVILNSWGQDPAPSAILDNVMSAATHPARVSRPHFRRGWLENGPGPDARRGDDSFVAVDWPQAIELLGTELARVYGSYGRSAVFGGSYGWSSAGRFHHAQSQVHRFLNALGGYVRSVNTYSSGASEVIWPHVFGISLTEFLDRCTSWDMVEGAEIFLCFGGLPPKNFSVAPGGLAKHLVGSHLAEARRRGASFVLIGPQRRDLPDFCNADWMPIRPGTDTAMILGLCSCVLEAGQVDQAFLDRRTVGADQFFAYLRGQDDGVVKSADWASNICGIPPQQIRNLASAIARSKTFINVSFSIQRSPNGANAVWAAAALAAMLGLFGKPDHGFGHGYGAFGSIGERGAAVRFPAFDQGQNEETAFIPVARMADCLLSPGGSFDYNGKSYRFPDLKLIYWAGGNPFHHHAELAKLRCGLVMIDTMVVHEQYWTATAQHADIVLPATLPIERNDIAASPRDNHVVAMKQIFEPYREARDDYSIFSELAARLNVGDTFTGGKSAEDWLEELYRDFEGRCAAKSIDVPDFAGFWNMGVLELPEAPSRVFLSDKDLAGRQAHKIALHNKEIAGLGYVDCPGHAAWFDHPVRVDDEFPLYLLANQPRGRLHSQLDVGATSQAAKTNGLETLTMHPQDAAIRGLTEGAAVLVESRNGGLLAGLRFDRGLRPGVVQVPTGARFFPLNWQGRTICRAGSVNALTLDKPESTLTQAAGGAISAVQVRLWDGPVDQPIWNENVIARKSDEDL
jgi:biotin/methionine sulfoxide reductase